MKIELDDFVAARAPVFFTSTVTVVCPLGPMLGDPTFRFVSENVV